MTRSSPFQRQAVMAVTRKGRNLLRGLVAGCAGVAGVIFASCCLPAATFSALHAISEGGLRLSPQGITGDPKIVLMARGGEEAEPGQLELRRKWRKPTKLPVRIDDVWYDLGPWRTKHPGGPQFIDYYEGRDATEVMHAFHTDKARKMFPRMPRLKEEQAAEYDKKVAPVSTLTRNFRKLRAKLEADGWWKRDPWHEAKLLGIWGTLFFGGLGLAHLPGWFACTSIIPLALATTQAGWLGHDYVHGVDDLSCKLRLMGPLGGGLSPTWWSDKHNKHHALTNQMGADEDIATAPVLYVWEPHPEDDSPMRRYQHFLWPLAFSTLFLMWRFDSFVNGIKAVRRKRPNAKRELAGLLVHWAIIFANVPLPIIPLFIMLSGFVSATIVTVTHQSEELFSEFQDDWVASQFMSTRDAITRTGFTTWLWGGMQYQLEHHLFPSMPRSNYPALSKILRKFAQDNNIPGGYRVDDEFALVARNVQTYKRVAQAPGGNMQAPRVRDGDLVTGVAYLMAAPS